MTDSRGVFDLSRMISGFQVSQMISVAARLGIADRLAAGPRSVDGLADETGVDADALERLLHALVVVGVFQETDGGRFTQSALSEYLRSDHPQSLASLAGGVGEDLTWSSWGALTECIRTGRTAIEQLHGVELFEFLEREPKAAATFNETMARIGDSGAGLPDGWDFSSFSTVVDVGGGRGRLLASILEHNPELQGVLFERGDAAQEGRLYLESTTVADRCRVVEGNFFEEVPPADVYVLKYVLHDWDDDRARKILTNCARAIHRDGRLLLVENLLAGKTTPAATRFIDLAMLVFTGGRERSVEQYEALTRSTGFSLTRCVPLGTMPPLVVLECQPSNAYGRV